MQSAFPNLLPAQPRMEDLYPPIEPLHSGWLDADAGHRIYFEVSGNAQGAPVLFLHGGPGSSSNPGQRRFFDPSFYRIVLFDQRGCGRSTPGGETAGNTTADLLEDIERLRRHLAGFDRHPTAVVVDLADEAAVTVGPHVEDPDEIGGIAPDMAVGVHRIRPGPAAAARS